MKIVAFVLVSLVALIPPADAGSASQTFPVSLDRAWSTTEKVLDVLGWEIDKSDRTVGWLTTDSRKLDGEDYGVYAKGTRHRLRIHLKAEGGEPNDDHGGAQRLQARTHPLDRHGRAARDPGPDGRARGARGDREVALMLALVLVLVAAGVFLVPRT